MPRTFVEEVDDCSSDCSSLCAGGAVHQQADEKDVCVLCSRQVAAVVVRPGTGNAVVAMDDDQAGVVQADRRATSRPIRRSVNRNWSKGTLARLGEGSFWRSNVRFRGAGRCTVGHVHVLQHRLVQRLRIFLAEGIEVHRTCGSTRPEARLRPCGRGTRRVVRGDYVRVAVEESASWFQKFPQRPVMSGSGTGRRREGGCAFPPPPPRSSRDPHPREKAASGC